MVRLRCARAPITYARQRQPLHVPFTLFGPLFTWLTSCIRGIPPVYVPTAFPRGMHFRMLTVHPLYVMHNPVYVLLCGPYVPLRVALPTYVICLPNSVIHPCIRPAYVLYTSWTYCVRGDMRMRPLRTCVTA